jgi:hypothetical protein
MEIGLLDLSSRKNGVTMETPQADPADQKTSSLCDCCPCACDGQGIECTVIIESILALT